MSMPWRVGSPARKVPSNGPSTGQRQENEVGAGTATGGLFVGAGLRGGGLRTVVLPPPGYRRSRWPGWMVYGERIPFQAARSRRVMPLSVAMRYRFWPRCTVTTTPGFGVDTATGPRTLPLAVRLTTRLLAQPASTRAAATIRHTPLRVITLIRLVP